MRHLITLTDLTTAEVERIFVITQDLKAKFAAGLREALLPGRVMGLLFEKPSLRTRVSFEAGMVHLGGSTLFLGDEVGFGARETIADFGRVLSQYVDVIVVRANRHQTLVDLAAHCSCSVINGLTDRAHPCQALADLYTLKELAGRLRGQTLAFVGDSNNVARSLVHGCGRIGMKIILASPPAYQFDHFELDEMRREMPGLELRVTDDPQQAVRGALAVYTDVWTSMGQESQRDQRLRDFTAYQVNADLMKHAPNAYFMHCLPAHRGEEVSAEVIDGPQSIILQQAANRLHLQKGILTWMLGRTP